MNGATWFLLSLSATQRNHCQGNGLGDDKGEMSPNVLDFIQTLRIDSIGVEYVGEATRSWNTTTFDVNLLTLLLCCTPQRCGVLCIYVVSPRRQRRGRTCWYKGPSLVGSLAGAAHLLNNNAGVLWRAQTERKSVVEQKGKSSLNDDFQYEYSLRNHGLSILSLNLSSMICIVRGVRKVTTGITGLWRPRVHIDVAFWFFDVGSSYSRIAAGSMDKIVHLLTGNVSWV